MSDIQKQLHDAFLSDETQEIKNVLGVGSGSLADAINFYKKAYKIRVRESMNDRFEVFAKVFPDYEKLREKYITNNPSTFYSLDDYGLNFSNWLLKNNYSTLMVDLARLEEELDLFTRKEVPKKADQDFSTDDLNQKLRLTHGRLLAFDSATYTVWKNATPVQKPQDSEKVLIYYRGSDIMVKLLQNWEYALLKEFKVGSTLENGMSQLLQTPTNSINPDDFRHFFSFLASAQLLRKI